MDIGAPMPARCAVADYSGRRPASTTASASRTVCGGTSRVAAYGTAATVQEQLERWDDAADVTMVGLPPGLAWPRIEATLRAAAPGASRG